jgi:hypothetical protein
MEFFAAIHVPEKFGLRPGFIGNFGQPPKKGGIIQPGMVEASSNPPDAPVRLAGGHVFVAKGSEGDDAGTSSVL